MHVTVLEYGGLRPVATVRRLLVQTGLKVVKAGVQQRDFRGQDGDRGFTARPSR
jgi:hypothetical protein